MNRVIQILRNRLYIIQFAFFLIAKLLFALVEMPRYRKTQSYLPYLIVSFIFYVLTVGAKLYNHFPKIIKDSFVIFRGAFLLWIVCLLNLIFAYALCDDLDWVFMEKVFVMLCLFCQTLVFTLISNEQYITKAQFIFNQLLLTVNILSIAIKTVLFLQNEPNVSDKDIVLLNLTTQIALSIITMDVIDRSYQKYKAKKVLEDMSRIEKQMVMIS